MDYPATIISLGLFSLTLQPQKNILTLVLTPIILGGMVFLTNVGQATYYFTFLDKLLYCICRQIWEPFPATLIYSVHLYWGYRGLLRSQFTSVMELKAAPDGKPCCWLSTYFLLYIFPHLSFTSILSLPHDLFVLFLSALPSVPFLILSLWILHSLPSEEGKERRNREKTRDSRRARDSVCVYVAHSR